jgi:hypothetical protein
VENNDVARRINNILVEKSASKIQSAFRKHQARLKLKKQAAWQIHEKLEYSSEQTEAKVRVDRVCYCLLTRLSCLAERYV